MNILQHTRNERNLCLKQNRLDRSYRDTLLKLSLKYWQELVSETQFDCRFEMVNR